MFSHLLVRLFVNKITQETVDVHEMFVRVRAWDKEQSIRF